MKKGSIGVPQLGNHIVQNRQSRKGDNEPSGYLTKQLGKNFFSLHVKMEKHGGGET